MIDHLKPFVLGRGTHSLSGWKSTVVTTEEEFDALESDWNCLTRESACTVFQHFDWLRTWWKHFGPRGRCRLHIVVLSYNSNIVGIAPLYIDATPVFGVIPVRRVCFLGRRTSDYLDVIAKRGFERKVAERLLLHFQFIRSHWDVVLLEDIPEHSATRTLLCEAATDAGFFVRCEVTEYCPQISLPDSWDAYLKKLPKKARHEIRRRERLLKHHFDLQFESVHDHEMFDQAFADFIALHQHRWNARNEPGTFADPVCRAFQCEAASRLFRHGLVRLNFLKLNGRRSVGSYTFVHDSTYALYLLGMHCIGRAGSFSPGLVMCSFDLRQAIQEGQCVFDFMRGTEAYKYEFLARNQPNWRLTLNKDSWFAHRLGRVQRNLVLIWELLVRRVHKEIWRFQRARQRYGLFSPAIAAYICGAAFSCTRDTVRKTSTAIRSRVLQKPRQ